MGVDRAYVSGLELGQRNPTVVTLWHVAKALGVKLQLFFDEDKPRRRTRSARA
jgi:transcriptional regulator with XRE-family HTH domain